MNIAILHYSVPPIVGGVESVIGHHARLMAAHGHKVSLIAARGESQNADIPLTRLPLADSRHEEVAAVKAELDRGSIPPEFDKLTDMLAAQLLHALSGIDVLVAHNVCSLNKNLALTAALHKLHGTGRLPRLILWHHDLAWTTPRYQNELYDGYPWDLLRQDWGNITHVVVSALRQEELSRLMGIPEDKVHVIPNGVDVERFYKFEEKSREIFNKIKLLDSAPILLLPVRITPRKNIELALYSLAELKRSYPQAALVVTGPLGPHNADNIHYFEKLRSLRSQLKLEGSAHFLAEHSNEFLPDEVIADFFRAADALFFPSREEGFGIPLIEAAFSRMPAFCADIPPLRELGMNDVHYFSVDEDPTRVAALIASFFQSSAAAKLAMRARASFRWEAIYREQIVPLLQKG